MCIIYVFFVLCEFAVVLRCRNKQKKLKMSQDLKPTSPPIASISGSLNQKNEAKQLPSINTIDTELNVQNFNTNKVLVRKLFVFI